MRSSVLLCLHIAVLLAITFLLATGSQAYYALEPPDPFSLREREHAPPSTTGIFFTIQDNFSQFIDPGGTPPLLLPHSDRFVPADIVEINIPVFGVFSHPASPSTDPVANMLYANLKIKKLLEEYAALQERAKNLLAEEPPPFSGTGTETNQPDSIQQTLKNIYLSLATVDETVLSDAPNPEKNPPSGSQENKALINAFHQLNRAISPRTSPVLPASPTDMKSGNRSTPGMESQPAADRPNKFAPENTQASSASYQDAITLPWILELPFRIFSYLLEHKITALVVGFFSLMLINIIFGSRT